jgi:hypothetical protein
MTTKSQNHQQCARCLEVEETIDEILTAIHSSGVTAPLSIGDVASQETQDAVRLTIARLARLKQRCQNPRAA